MSRLRAAFLCRPAGAGAHEAAMLFATVLLIGFFLLLLVAAISDIARMEIPDTVSVVLVATYPLAALAVGLPLMDIGVNLAVGAALFALGFGLFCLGVFGGGDVKLIAAAGVWLGLAGMPAFALSMALLGGVLALVVLTARRFATPSPAQPAFLNRLVDKANGVPYGVAIAGGGWLSVAHTPLAQTLLAAVR
jgi:prepilin peptidase CpaA